MKRLLILGAANPEIIRLVVRYNDAHPEERWEVAGFLDNNTVLHGTQFMDFPVLGAPEILRSPEYQDCFVVNNITRDCRTRRQTTEQVLQYTQRFTHLIHPQVDLLHVKVGIGTVVHEGCIISSGTEVREHGAIMLGARVGHDCLLGKYVFIGPSATVLGRVRAGDEVLIGAGAVLYPRVSLGTGAKVAAGAVVTKDVGHGCLAFGNPARIIAPDTRTEGD